MMFNTVMKKLKRRKKNGQSVKRQARGGYSHIVTSRGGAGGDNRHWFADAGQKNWAANFPWELSWLLALLQQFF